MARPYHINSIPQTSIAVAFVVPGPFLFGSSEIRSFLHVNHTSGARRSFVSYSTHRVTAVSPVAILSTAASSMMMPVSAVKSPARKFTIRTRVMVMLRYSPQLKL